MIISMKVAFGIGIFLIALMVLAKLLNKKNKINNIVSNLILIFSVVSLLEIFMFNLTSYKLLNKKYEFEEFDTENIKLNNIYYNRFSNTYRKFVEGESSIELLDINKEVGTVHIDISGIDLYDIRLDYADETSDNYYFWIPGKKMVSNYDRSKYIPCFFSGNVSKLKLIIENLSEYDEFKINKISINEQIPIKIEFGRYLILLFLSIGIFLLLKLNIFSKPYDSKNIAQNLIYFGIIVLFSLIGVMLSKFLIVNYNDITDMYSTKFVDSLINKRADLDIEVPERN